MTSFSEGEQWVLDLPWYAVDLEGRIGHFTTGGEKLFPPVVAESREDWEVLNNYFENLPAIQEGNYIVCPDLRNKLDSRLVPNIFGYIKPSAEMSARGLFAYDSPPDDNERSYIRVTMPKKELKFDDLPEEIKNILQNFRLSEIDFTQNSLILDEMANKCS
ncbi:MAG: hypothetical protein JSS81_15325 [Acidobacteria bacterium]|nr:hypothetical protein [Acidobacteriota bacterium]